MASPNVVQPNAETLARLHDAEEVASLRRSRAFNRIMQVIAAAVNAALRELEENANPRNDVYLCIVYRERKRIQTFINGYIDATINERREEIASLFRSLGIPEAVINANLDTSLEFLNPIGGSNGNPQSTR